MVFKITDVSLLLNPYLDKNREYNSLWQLILRLYLELFICLSPFFKELLLLWELLVLFFFYYYLFYPSVMSSFTAVDP